MAMLRLEQESFSTGRAPFKDHHPGGKETTARVYVEVAIQGIKESSFLALVDTGAPWSIVDREIAEEAGLLDAEGHTISISHRGGTTSGKLVPTTMTLVAEEGNSLTVEATVFVPKESLPPPTNFIGYSGFLERIRLGLDPQNNQIYFGGASSETPVTN